MNDTIRFDAPSNFRLRMSLAATLLAVPIVLFSALVTIFIFDRTAVYIIPIMLCILPLFTGITPYFMPLAYFVTKDSLIFKYGFIKGLSVNNSNLS